MPRAPIPRRPVARDLDRRDSDLVQALLLPKPIKPIYTRRPSLLYRLLRALRLR